MSLFSLCKALRCFVAILWSFTSVHRPKSRSDCENGFRGRGIGVRSPRGTLFKFLDSVARVGAILAFASMSSYVLAQSTSEAYPDPTTHAVQTVLIEHPGERIDLFTGQLQLNVVEVEIPGSGGFPLRVERTYRLRDRDFIEPTGVNWTIHFGRLRTTGATPCISPLDVFMDFELPNGRIERFFPTAAGINITNPPIFMSANLWRLDCLQPGTNSGYVVTSPEGVRYELTQLSPTTTFGLWWWYPRVVSDRNGNRFDLTYVNPTTSTGLWLTKTISSGDGRGVTFNYTPQNLLDNITTSDGRKWTYSYRQLTSQVVGEVINFFHLTKVTRPDGSAWVYDYYGPPNPFSAIAPENASSYRMHTLTYPWGGTISYTYTFSTALVAGGAVAYYSVVKTKTTSDSGLWDFNFAFSSRVDTLDLTTVNTPDGKVTAEHYGYNSVRAFECWKIGLPTRRATGPVIGGPLETQTFMWSSALVSSSQPSGCFNVSRPLQTQRQIVRDGNTYTTTYSTFDPYGNPQNVTESSIGPPGFSRAKTLAYQVNTSSWILHQFRDKSFDGFSINRVIDSKGNVTQETRYGVTTNYTYDPPGNLSTQMNARGFTTTFSNYFRGIPQTEIHPEGITISRVGSAAGNVVSETDGKGDTKGYNYDGLNRLAGAPAINFPRVGAADVSIVWGAASRTLTRGTFTQTVSYDGFGRTVSIASADTVSPSQNSTITMRYDPLGRRTFQSYPNSISGTTYTYDILDRVKTVAHPDGTSKSYTYNATAVDVKNERNITHTFSYRAFGDPDKRELIGITVPTPNASTSIARNSIGQVTQVAQGGRSRIYGYDPVTHFLTSVNDPETGVTLFGRDPVGNMTSRQVGLSPVTTYTYDGLNRLTFIDYPVPTTDVTKTYYGDGLLKDVINGSATRNFEYDPDKNLTLERLAVDGSTYEINHSYSVNDARDSTTYPSGTIVTYAANGFGRPTKATPFLNSVDYHPTGEVETIAYANGVTTSVTLNNRLWPQRFTSLKSGTTTPLADFQYTGYDGVGNITSFNDFVDATNAILTLSYDEIDRLVTAGSSTDGPRSFAYDGVGNITSQTLGTGTLIYSYDSVTNRLTGISGGKSYSFQYDIYGNVAHNGSQSFAYNDAGQMICARCGQPDGSAYLYDGLGMRVRAQKNGVTTYFMYGLDGNLLFEKTPQTASGGVETKEYVYLSGRQVAVKTTSILPTTVTASAASISASVGSSVTLTVTISGISPTGTVTFREGTTVLGIATVTNGSASLTLSGLTVGSHTIVASYSGDSNNLPSSTTLTVNIYDLSWLPAILQLLLDD